MSLRSVLRSAGDTLRFLGRFLIPRPLRRILRRLLNPVLDLPFARDEANGFLPWIIACMLALCGLMLCGALSLHMGLGQSRAHYGGQISVQVPHSASQERQADAVLGVLRRYEGVKGAHIVAHEQVKEALAPWLGTGAALDVLPLPTLVEAERREGGTLDAASLEQAIAQVAPDAELDLNQHWVEQFLGFARMLEALALLIAALIIGLSLAVLVLAVRTSFRLHGKAITLLHSFGATDGYIARQFAINAFLLALRGATIGAAAAATVYLLVHLLTTRFAIAALPVPAFTFAHAAALLTLPAVTSLAAWMTARRAVLATLRRLP